VLALARKKFSVNRRCRYLGNFAPRFCWSPHSFLGFFVLLIRSKPSSRMRSIPSSCCLIVSEGEWQIDEAQKCQFLTAWRRSVQRPNGRLVGSSSPSANSA